MDYYFLLGLHLDQELNRRPVVRSCQFPQLLGSIILPWFAPTTISFIKARSLLVPISIYRATNSPFFLILLRKKDSITYDPLMPVPTQLLVIFSKFLGKPEKSLDITSFRIWLNLVGYTDVE